MPHKLVKLMETVMKDNWLTLKIEGLASEERYIRVSDFIQEVGVFIGTIRRIDLINSSTKQPTFYYRIVDLNYSSPATVIMEALPIDPNIDMRENTIKYFFSILGDIAQGKSDIRIDYVLLENIKRLVTPIGQKIGNTTIITSKNTIILTKEFNTKVDLIMAPEDLFIGAIRGMLEYINIHGDKNVFRIYPDIGPSRVTCNFPQEFKEEAIRSIGKFVEVFGTLKYKAVADYPHEIDVQAIEAFPPEDELPSLDDLLGIAPNATGNLSSEEFVRQLRDAKKN